MSTTSVQGTGTEPATGRPSRRDRTHDVVGLVARLALGGVLLVAGYLKATDLDGSVRSVAAYDLFDYDIVTFIGLTLPVFEIAVGALLILGLFTRAAGGLGGLLMMVFIAGIASAWARGLTIDCGCFGTGGPVDPDSTRYLEEILRDAALTLAGLWLVLRPHTLFALDTILTRTGPTRGTTH